MSEPELRGDTEPLGYAEPLGHAEPLGYAAALAELEVILSDLDDPQLDIDVLGDLVARALELIAMCRERIDAASLRVTEIVADLD